MINLPSLLRQGALALVLAGTALGALAGPTSYHVDLNTAALQGGKILDFFFLSDPAAAATTATVSNLSGALGGVAAADGVFNFNGNGGFTIGNNSATQNYVDYNAVFGGLFSFDITFSDSFLAGPNGFGSSFSVSVLDENFGPLTNGGGIVVFDLFPETGIAPNVAAGFGSATLINVGAVPEPSELLLVLTGLGLVGFTVRRRQPRAA
jgi:hypothetical protein